MRSQPGNALRGQVALACRILAMKGHGDFTLGHVSARIPETQTFWIKGAGLGLEEVRPVDVSRADVTGRKISGRRRLHNETVIHTAIYRARPDVHCVIHTHPFYATAFAALDQPLPFFIQNSAILTDGVALFHGTPGLLVRAEHGAALVRDLGSAAAILLRYHGVVVVGPSVPSAVLRVLALEQAAQAALLLAAGGGATGMDAQIVHRIVSDFAAVPGRRADGLWTYLVRSLRQHERIARR